VYSGAVVRETGARKHRTEVAEGDLRLGAKGLRVNSGAFVRETGARKHRTEVTEVTEGI
jgi:hypothetical protein